MTEPAAEIHCLWRRDPVRNMARFYRLETAPDLFGGAVLIRSWGQIGTIGRERREWFETAEAAATEAEAWRRRKLRRGYGGMSEIAAGP